MEEIKMTTNDWHHLSVEEKFKYHHHLILCTDGYDCKDEIIDVYGRIHTTESALDQTSDNDMPVEFFEDIEGHSLSGIIEDGYGWNVPPSRLIIYNTVIDGATMKLIQAGVIDPREVTS